MAPTVACNVVTEISALLIVCILFSVATATMQIVAGGSCTKGTCLNGGVCDTAYVGDGFACICPQTNKSDYGPRCEIATRSYSTVKTHSGVQSTATWHELPEFKFGVFVSVTFEFLGECLQERCPIILLIGKSSSIICQVELLKNGQVHVKHIGVNDPSRPDILSTSTLPRIEPGSGSGNRYWSSFSFSLQTGMTDQELVASVDHSKKQFLSRLNYCSLKYKKCEEAKVFGKYVLHPRDKDHNVKIRVGNFHGCIRYLRVNDFLVNFGTALSIEGNPSGTSPFCAAQSASCNYPGTSRPVCGVDSVCYGAMSPAYRKQTVDCTCRCLSAKRRERETISTTESCIAKPGDLPNECNKDSPVLNVGYKAGHVKWTLQNNARIPAHVDPKINMFLSVEAEFKSRQTWKSGQILLQLFPTRKTWPWNILSFRVEKIGSWLFVAFCFGNYCPRIRYDAFSDGNWHRLHATIRKHELIFGVDGITKLISSSHGDLAHTLEIMLTVYHTCVRNIRMGNIYIPMGDGDVTADNSTYYIKMEAPSNAVVMPDCDGFTINPPYMEPTKPPPTLSPPVQLTTKTDTAISTRESIDCKNECSKNEDCLKSPEKPEGECRCKAGFGRDAEGSCVIHPRPFRVLLDSKGSAASVHCRVFASKLQLILPLLALIYAIV